MTITSAKRPPWISLTLLLVAYASLGQFLSTSHSSWIAWLIAIGWVFLLATLFISSLERVRSIVARLLQSDTAAIILLITVAALASVVLLWWHVFLYIVAVIATETLVRIDIESAKFTSLEAFWILITTSLIGLVLGWMY